MKRAADRQRLTGLTEADYHRLVVESRTRQGLPPRITDPVVIDLIVTLMSAPAAAAPGDRRSTGGRPATAKEGA